jgi:hypothetical protein
MGEILNSTSVWQSKILYIASLKEFLFKLVWSIGLVATIRIIAPDHYTFDVFDVRRAGYLSVAACYIVAFAWFASERRQILGLAFLLLLALKVTGVVSIGWGRVAVAALIVVAVVFAVEVVRQNTLLVLDLRRQHTSIPTKLSRGLFLWMPVALAASLGLLAHQHLQRSAVDFAYEYTPIDRYCKVGTIHAPCPSAPHANHFWPKSSLENISHHWHALFQLRQIALIEALTAHLPHVADNAFKTAVPFDALLLDLNKRVAASDVLGIPEDRRQTREEVLAGNVTLQGLENELLRLKALPPVTYSPGRGRFVRGIGEWIDGEPIAHTTAGPIAAMQARVEATKAEILNAAAPHIISPEELSKSFQAQAGRALVSANDNIKGDRIVPLAASSLPQARALLAAHVLAQLTANEAESKKRILALLRPASHNPGGFPPGAESLWNKQLKAIRVLAYCNLASEAHALSATETVHPCAVLGAVARHEALPLSFVESVHESISQNSRQAQFKLEEKTRTALLQVLSKPDAWRADAAALSEIVPPKINLGSDPCTVLPDTWAGCVANMLKAYAEHSYKGAREKADRAYKERLESFNKKAQRSGAEFIIFERNEAHGEILRGEESLHTIVKSTESALGVASVITLLALWITLIKSFLYIAALVFFDSNGPSSIQVVGSQLIQGTLPRFGKAEEGKAELGLDFDDANTVLITHRHLDFQEPSIVVAPWPICGVISRLVRRKYFGYTKGGRMKPDKPIYFSHGSGKQVVDWALKEGEEVIFGYAHFFGASANVKLRSRVSVRLSTLLFGRIVFHSARAQGGPGHLLLVVDKSARINNDVSSFEAVYPGRLLAFHAQTTFKVHNRLTLRAVLIDPFLLVRAEGPQQGYILVDPPTRQMFPFVGMIRHILRVLSPF